MRYVTSELFNPVRKSNLPTYQSATKKVINLCKIKSAQRSIMTLSVFNYQVTELNAVV